MFIPIGDENPRERFPYVNYSLIALNIVLHLSTAIMRATDEGNFQFLFDWCLLPAHADIVKMTTSMFLHGDIWHLAGNMLFLWIFGDNVEDRMGHVPYLFFYLLAGYAADMLHIIMTPEAGLALAAAIPAICEHVGQAIDPGHIPTLGASGAISGVLGAYVLFFPKQRVKMLLWIYFFIHIFYLPAWGWIGFWFAQQVFFALITADQLGGGVAWFAHIGGFVGGLGAGALFKFLLTPDRMRRLHGSTQVPRELSRASRRRRAEAHQPVITFVDEPQPEAVGIQYIEPEPTDTVAVLRVSDEMPPLPYVSRVVSGATGEDRSEVATRINMSRGLLAAGIPRNQAEHIQVELKGAGIRTLIIEYSARTRPPPPVYPTELKWDGDGLIYSAEGTTSRLPWSTPFLFVAANVAGAPMVDIYATRRLRIRVMETTDLFVRQHRAEVRSDFETLAEAIIHWHSGALLNDGIRVLAGSGMWGWLKYPGAGPFEAYSFWIYNLVIEQQPFLRSRT